MAITIREFAEMCAAEILGGNPQQPIDAAANLDEAGVNQLTFLGNPKYLNKLRSTTASAVLVPKGTPSDAANTTTCLLVVDDPEMAFIACLHRLYPQKDKQRHAQHQGRYRPHSNPWRRHMRGGIRVHRRAHHARQPLLGNGWVPYW